MSLFKYYSHDVIAIELLLIHVVDEEQQADDLANHGLIVELVVLRLHPHTQQLQQVSQQVDVPPVRVKLLHDLPREDGRQLRHSVP